MYNLGYDASGRTAFIAEKEGVQTTLMELFPYENLQNFYGMGDISFFWDGMGELDPGTYRIYMASRTDGEPAWTKAKGSGIDEYTLTMHENGGYELQEGRPTGIGSVTGKASGADKLVDVVCDEATTYAVGEDVLLTGSLEMGLKAVWWAYIAPLLLLVAVLLVAAEASGSEPLAALSALAVLAVYYGLLYLNRGRLTRKFSFTIKHIK